MVDQHRENSLISVHANGGNSESFHIRLPDDRIVAGAAGTRSLTPPGLEWPEYDFLKNIQTELFKVRNENGVVVGAASRMSGSPEQHGSFVEWVVHLPARGSMFMTSRNCIGHRCGGGTRLSLSSCESAPRTFVDHGSTKQRELGVVSYQGARRQDYGWRDRISRIDAVGT